MENTKNEVNKLMKEVSDLKKEIEALKVRRIYQQQIVPDAVKMRHMSEGNRFVRSGLSTDRPTEGENGTDSSACYFATDTGVLSVWNGTSWLDVTLS